MLAYKLLDCLPACLSHEIARLQKINLPAVRADVLHLALEYFEALVSSCA